VFAEDLRHDRPISTDELAELERGGGDGSGAGHNHDLKRRRLARERLQENFAASSGERPPVQRRVVRPTNPRLAVVREHRPGARGRGRGRRGREAEQAQGGREGGRRRATREGTHSRKT
jgi:hypothetical protein